MSTHSIEKRLLKHTLIIVSSLLLLSGLLVAASVNVLLERDYNHNLLAKARLLATLTKNRLPRIELDFADEFMPEFSDRNRPEYFELWYADGRSLEQSVSLRRAKTTLPIERPTTSTFLQNGHTVKDVTLPDGRAGRRVQVVFFPQIPRKIDRTQTNLQQQPQMVLVLAKERESLLHLRKIIYALLAITTGLALLILSLMLKCNIHKDLKPLKQLQGQIRKMDTEHLQQRLHLPVIPDELKDLVTQFNALLDRMQQSFQREQRFSADVAHELKTPIAEIRALAEVALQCRQDTEQSATTADADFYEDILAASHHMQCIVNDLLTLARCENGQVSLKPEKIDLQEAITTAWRPHQAEAASKHIVLNIQFATPCFVVTSANEFQLILNNLLANAVSYSPPCSEIGIRVDGSPLFLCISNRTDNLSQDDIPYLFERMWRKDAARTTAIHAGIGLAVVKAHANLLGLGIKATLSDDSELSLTLSNFVIADPAC